MCSLGFFFKPREESSIFSTFFDLGNFKGFGCKGSTQERYDTVLSLMVVYGVATLLALVLIYFTSKTLRNGLALARRCDLLEEAIKEHDEYCAKRGIRGRAETCNPALIEGFFMDTGSMSAWLNVNNLEANIESVDEADYADLLPSAEEFIEIEQMREAFNSILRTIKETNKLPAEMDVDGDDDNVRPEMEPPGATDAAAVAAVESSHKLITAPLKSPPTAAASKLKTVEASVTPGLLTASTPPPETPAAEEKQPLLSKKKKKN